MSAVERAQAALAEYRARTAARREAFAAERRAWEQGRVQAEILFNWVGTSTEGSSRERNRPPRRSGDPTQAGYVPDWAEPL